MRFATNLCCIDSLRVRGLAALPAENRASPLSASQSSYTAVGSVVMATELGITVCDTTGLPSYH